MNYTITDDPAYFDEKNGITEELREQLERCYEIANTGKRSGWKHIQRQIKKFPKNPSLKNYLSVWYSKTGNIEKAVETNEWIVREHPDYLFGKTNLVQFLLDKEKYEEVPGILGNEMELHLLYPGREVFHVSEFTAFLYSVIRYYVAIGDMEAASSRNELLIELAPDHDSTAAAQRCINLGYMKSGMDRLMAAEKSRIKVEEVPLEPDKALGRPVFNHDQVKALYQYDLTIPTSLLEGILKLPMETLLPDLHAVLYDSMERFHHYTESAERHGWNQETTNFAIHAIYLLGELESTESIKLVLDILRKNRDLLDFYFGDHLTAGLWEPVYKIAKHQVDELQSFMYQPGVNAYAKAVVIEVMEQIALHDSSRRSEVIEWFREVLTFYAHCDMEANIVDTDAFGLTVWAVLNIQGRELLPEIEKLYDLGYVSISMLGTYDDVVRSFDGSASRNHKKLLLSLVERYKEITSTWHGYLSQGEKEEPGKLKVGQSDLPAQRAAGLAKVGRNDPCPCGSGKKYKRCCL